MLQFAAIGEIMAGNALVKSTEINLDQLTPEAAWQFLTEDDRIQCEQIKELHINKLLNENDWWWDLGVLAVELSQLRKEAKSTIQGAQKLDLIALALGWEDTVSTRLKDAAFVVDRWGTKENYHKLVNMRDSEGWRLSFYHIRTISKVQDNEAAFEFAQRTIDDRLSVKELQKCIAEEKPSGRKQGAGRPMAVPRNANECIRSMIKKMETLPKSFKDAWFSDRFNLTNAMDELDEDDINNPTFLKQIDGLNKLVGALNNGLSLTKAVLKSAIDRADWSILEDLDSSEALEDIEDADDDDIIDVTAVNVEEDDQDTDVAQTIEDVSEVVPPFSLDEEPEVEEVPEVVEEVEEAPRPVPRKAAIPAKKDMLSSNRSRIRR